MKKSLLLASAFAFLILSCKDKEEDVLSIISYNPTPYTLKIKTKNLFPEMIIPADNPMTTEGVELGRFLFFDNLLSANGQMSCASCHLPEAAFTDKEATSKGVDGIAGKRSSMSLANIGYVNTGLFWDGRVKTLEEQAFLPVEDPIELHSSWTKVVAKLQAHADYPTRFRKAFGIKNTAEITKELAIKAIAQFERTLISDNARIDQIFRKDAEITDDEYDGNSLFFNASAPDAQCGHCHTTPFYSSNDFFNNGLDSAKTLDMFKDKGRGQFTKKLNDNGKFRTPSLRNIELTAPYMHDGRFKTLEEVVDHYASGGHYADNVDPFIPQIKFMNPGNTPMNAKQKRQIIAFLKTLTDTSFVNNPQFKSPF